MCGSERTRSTCKIVRRLHPRQRLGRRERPVVVGSFFSSRSTTAASSTLLNAGGLDRRPHRLLAQARSSPLAVSHLPARRIAASPANSTGAATLKPVRPSILQTRMATTLSRAELDGVGGNRQPLRLAQAAAILRRKLAQPADELAAEIDLAGVVDRFDDQLERAALPGRRNGNFARYQRRPFSPAGAFFQSSGTATFSSAARRHGGNYRQPAETKRYAQRRRRETVAFWGLRWVLT